MPMPNKCNTGSISMVLGMKESNQDCNVIYDDGSNKTTIVNIVL
jgi:hypothetical protein